MLKGQHLIAGEWVAGDNTFDNAPLEGPAQQFSVGTPEHVARAAAAAEDAFWSYGYSTRAERANFLNAIADEIEARAEAITEIGHCIYDEIREKYLFISPGMERILGMSATEMVEKDLTEEGIIRIGAEVKSGDMGA